MPGMMSKPGMQHHACLESFGAGRNGLGSSCRFRGANRHRANGGSSMPVRVPASPRRRSRPFRDVMKPEETIKLT